MENKNDGEMGNEERLAKKIIDKSADQYLDTKNITGMAHGLKESSNKNTGEPCVIVYVEKKLPKKDVPESELIPRKIQEGGEEIRTDVIEVGKIYALGVNIFRNRPVRPGDSIGHFNVTAGTLGAPVIDLTDGSTVILSNNHVLANENNAQIGDNILQPGVFDGGLVDNDVIGHLLRFVPIDFNEHACNNVDAAICSIAGGNNILTDPHNGVPAPSQSYPAVGLLFAGSITRTIFCPIQSVLDGLNIRLQDGVDIASPEIGMNVQKSGRTTGGTDGTIKELCVTVQVRFGPRLARFTNVFATGFMSEGGDSGSLLVCDDSSSGGGSGGGGSVDLGGGGGGTGGGCSASTKYVAPRAQLKGEDASDFWDKSMDFERDCLEETKGGKKFIHLFYNQLSRVNQVMTMTHSSFNEDAERNPAEELTSFIFNVFKDYSNQELLFTQSVSEDLDSVIRALDLEKPLTPKETAELRQASAIVKELEGMSVPDVVDKMNDEKFAERIPAGKKYLCNKRSKEIHDLTGIKPNCQVNEIIDSGNAIFPNTQSLEGNIALKELHEQGFDNCHYCIGDSKR